MKTLRKPNDLYPKFQSSSHFRRLFWQDYAVPGQKPRRRFFSRDTSYSLADSGVDLDLRCIENVLTDYDSQHLQKQEST